MRVYPARGCAIKLTYCLKPVPVLRSCGNPIRRGTMKEKKDVWQGTLAIMVLKTLDVLGPQHGYGIACRIEQISDSLLSVNHGTLPEGKMCPFWIIWSGRKRLARTPRTTEPSGITSDPPCHFRTKTSRK
jgi:hypothetical protein